MSAHADWPAALGARPLDTAEAYQALEAFGAEYGREPLVLLLHAAVPETLRADLLHLIRVNFLPGRDDPSLEADVLFAPLTRALGGGRFRIEPQVRWHALILLRSLYRDEPRARAVRVAELLWRHLDRLARSARCGADAELAEYIEVQRWVALAYLDPRGAAHAFAQALQAQTLAGPAARLRLGGLAAAIELPLAGEQELLAYARGLDALVTGDADGAVRWLGALGSEPLQVAGVTLKPAHEWLAQGAPAPAGRPGAPAAGESEAAARRCLLIRGDEFEAAHPDPPINRLAVLAALSGLPGVQVESAREGVSWPALLRDLLQVDRVVVDLRGETPSVYLLLGIAWALRECGVIAVATHRTSPDGVPWGFDVHLGTTRAHAPDEAALRATLQHALDANERSAPYAAWPELQPPTLRAETVRPLPERLKPQACLLLGLGPPETRSFQNARRAIDRLKIDPHALTALQTLRGLDRSTVQALATTDLALVDWAGATPDEFVALGLRLGLQPLGTLIAAKGRELERRWMPAQGVLQYDPDRIENSDVSSLIADQLRAPPAPNAVYAALPDLHPPQWTPPQPDPAARRHRVFVSYVHVYEDIAHALIDALSSAGDIEVLSDRRLLAGDDWAQLLGQWLHAADAVVAVVGPRTAPSRHAMAEIDAAQAQGKLLIPVAVDISDWSELPAQLKPLQALTIGRSERSGRRRDDALELVVAQIRLALERRGTAVALDLHISRPEPGRLHFDWVDAGRRHEQVLHVQPRLIGPLLRQLSSSVHMENDPLKALRELLLPAGLKEALGAAAGERVLRLHLADAAATLPWELLLGWSGSAPAAPPPALLRVAGRLPEPSDLRRALLIGDPRNDGDPRGHSYAPLPAVERELHAVSSLLAARGFQVDISLREDAGAVLTALFAEPLRVLLLAGHGDLERRGDAGSQVAGLVLSQGAALGGHELLALEKVPELLILDAEWMGHLGDPDTGEVDPNAAPLRLLEAGASCVVAPAGSVVDASASEFTTTLLRELCEGSDIETALRAARTAAFRADPQSTTWAAYRVWSQPGYRLPRLSASTPQRISIPFQ